MYINTLLLSNNLVQIPAPASSKNIKLSVEYLGTFVSNIAYYGFTLSAAAVTALSALSEEEAGRLWLDIKPALESVTGADRKMDSYAVYKNFPREVLEMSQARYWVAQILMYMGLPNEYFAETEAERAPMSEMQQLRVLGKADDNSPEDIMSVLCANSARWTNDQREQALFLVEYLPSRSVHVDDFTFKENGVRAAAHMFIRKENPIITTATDVLRLAAVLSEGDASLRKPVKFRNFTRSERRRLAAYMEGFELDRLVEDYFLRPEIWKRLLSRLHPGDLGCPRVQIAYDKLYRGDFTSFNSSVEAGLKNRDAGVLAVMATRPGDFMRRFHKAYATFGREAVEAFVLVIGKLSTSQLLKLDGYLSTINERARLIYAPRGNWTKAQLADNTKSVITAEDMRQLRDGISQVVNSRLAEKYPQGFDVDTSADLVKLQTNDQELAPYGRGTVFEIPENMSFLRTATYWEQKSEHNTWFDNGWNFFDSEWKSVGTICWNSTDTRDNGCVFSGDPTNAHELKGRACQMIDLNLDALEASGVRYAVWSVLCFSNISFGEATDVLATLQWGEDAQKGNLYEPSRAQMVFPIKGDGLTKYVAYLDVVERKLVYMDAGLYGNASSADINGGRLSGVMPAFLEYLKSLPSVADVFKHGTAGSIPVTYSDAGRDISGDAYVFRSVNPDNVFNAVDLSEVLEDKSEPSFAVSRTPTI